MYGFSPEVRARKAASTSWDDWTFSVSRLIINAMYSCRETIPSLIKEKEAFMTQKDKMSSVAGDKIHSRIATSTFNSPVWIDAV